MLRSLCVLRIVCSLLSCLPFLIDADAAPGYYNVRFSVTPKDGGDRFKATDKIHRRVKVLADVKPVSVGVWASESAKPAFDASIPKSVACACLLFPVAVLGSAC